jgi:hypothetical protein
MTSMEDIRKKERKVERQLTYVTENLMRSVARQGDRDVADFAEKELAMLRRNYADLLDVQMRLLENAEARIIWELNRADRAQRRAPEEQVVRGRGREPSPVRRPLSPLGPITLPELGPDDF